MVNLWLRGTDAQAVIMVRFDLDRETRDPCGTVKVWKLNDGDEKVCTHSLVSAVFIVGFSRPMPKYNSK
jgi:hypothetical protein